MLRHRVSCRSPCSKTRGEHRGSGFHPQLRDRGRCQLRGEGCRSPRSCHRLAPRSRRCPKRPAICAIPSGVPRCPEAPPATLGCGRGRLLRDKASGQLRSSPHPRLPRRGGAAHSDPGLPHPWSQESRRAVVDFTGVVALSNLYSFFRRSEPQRVPTPSVTDQDSRHFHRLPHLPSSPAIREGDGHASVEGSAQLRHMPRPSAALSPDLIVQQKVEVCPLSVRRGLGEIPVVGIEEGRFNPVTNHIPVGGSRPKHRRSFALPSAEALCGGASLGAGSRTPVRRRQKGVPC